MVGALVCPAHVCAAPGVAAEPPELRLRGCSHLDPALLTELLELELATVSGELGEGRLGIGVICFPGAVVLSVRFADGQPIDRRFAGIPESLSERTLALAASELAVQIEGQQDLQTETWVERSGVAPADAPAKLLAELGGTATFASTPRHLGFGAVAGGALVLGAWGEIGLLGRLTRGSTSTSRVRVVQTLWSMGPRLRVRLPTGRLPLFAGLSVVVGGVRWEPEARVAGAEETPFSAFWGAALLELSSRVAISRRASLWAGIHGGPVLWPVRGFVQDEVVVKVSGATTGADLGMVLAF